MLSRWNGRGSPLLECPLSVLSSGDFCVNQLLTPEEQFQTMNFSRGGKFSQNQIERTLNFVQLKGWTIRRTRWKQNGWNKLHCSVLLELLNAEEKKNCNVFQGFSMTEWFFFWFALVMWHLHQSSVWSVSTLLVRRKRQGLPGCLVHSCSCGV